MANLHSTLLSHVQLKTSIGLYRTYIFEIDGDPEDVANTLLPVQFEPGDIIEFSTSITNDGHTKHYVSNNIKFIGQSGNEYSVGYARDEVRFVIQTELGTSYNTIDSIPFVNSDNTIMQTSHFIILKYGDVYYYQQITFNNRQLGTPDFTYSTVHPTLDSFGYYVITVGENGTSCGFGGNRALISNVITDLVKGAVPLPSDDPYDPSGDGSGYSGSGGGPAGTGGTGATGTGGLHDDTSDPIPTPSLPSSIVTGNGLFTAYNPNASQLAQFANKLWNRDPTTIDDWFRMLFGGDAFNAIIGLSLIPVAPSTGSSKNILLGNWDTGASAPVINNQYAEVNFGTLTLSEFWGNSIDYSPYTRVQLALPYIGIVDVDTDDVIGSVNTLVYHIDVFSGALCAMLHCVKGNLSSVIYQWSGSCGVTLPVTGQSFNAVVGAVMGVGAAALGGIAMASGPIGAAIGTAGSLAVGTGAVTGAAANMFGTMKGKVQKSGGFNASSGALGIMTPYFIITRPVQSIPSTQQATKGYPSNISAHLGDLSGYTEVTEVHLHNIPGTKDEVLEIESLLKKGVIF